MKTTRKHIRKNATRQIAQLLDQASYFEIETYSMAIDDSMNSNGSKEVDRAYVEDFLKNNYSRLIINVTYDENVKPISMTICDGPYHFNDEIYVSFSPKPIKVVNVEINTTAKPRMSYAAVKAYREQGFISPLNHGAKHVDQSNEDKDKVIKSVEVLWSESRYFNQLRKGDDCDINQVLDLDHYNSLAAMEVACYKRERYTGGYTKTKVRLTTGNDQVIEFRHDISPSEPTLSGSWCDWVDYCRAEAAKEAAQQIAQITPEVQPFAPVANLLH